MVDFNEVLAAFFSLGCASIHPFVNPSAACGGRRGRRGDHRTDYFLRPSGDAGRLNQINARPKAAESMGPLRLTHASPESLALWWRVTDASASCGMFLLVQSWFKVGSKFCRWTCIERHVYPAATASCRCGRPPN